MVFCGSCVWLVLSVGLVLFIELSHMCVCVEWISTWLYVTHSRLESGNILLRVDKLITVFLGFKIFIDAVICCTVYKICYPENMFNGLDMFSVPLGFDGMLARFYTFWKRKFFCVTVPVHIIAYTAMINVNHSYFSI